MRYDVFCKVVDNYGDAAVCWRLSRQLALEHGHALRLWIDRPEALQALCPAVDAALSRQRVDGVEILLWREGQAFDEAADVVVEGFGCGLPPAYCEALASRPGGGVWIVLEYLSAEPWVATHHGLPSPHPRLPVRRYYFFPGVVPGTGGVLRAADDAARQSAFEADPGAVSRFWTAAGFPPPAQHACRVSLFGYENAALAPLLAAWAGAERQTVLAVPAGRLRAQVTAFLGTAAVADGQVVRRGALEVRFLPFLPQPTYDELLWASDWNFVRGEDSFVRAQWAARPFVWHIYPQAEAAHQAKLKAFLACYCRGLAPGPAAALEAFWQAWNAPQGPAQAGMAAAWERLVRETPALRAHAASWAVELGNLGDLAGNLAHFCRERLK
jgi:uncharacterized repeat protein (TIGR03837 family)